MSGSTPSYEVQGPLSHYNNFWWGIDLGKSELVQTLRAEVTCTSSWHFQKLYKLMAILSLWKYYLKKKNCRIFWEQKKKYVPASAAQTHLLLWWDLSDSIKSSQHRSKQLFLLVQLRPLFLHSPSFPQFLLLLPGGRNLTQSAKICPSDSATRHPGSDFSVSPVHKTKPRQPLAF